MTLVRPRCAYHLWRLGMNVGDARRASRLYAGNGMEWASAYKGSVAASLSRSAPAVDLCRERSTPGNSARLSLTQHVENRGGGWQQHWPCHPNVSTMRKRQSHDVSRSETSPFYVIPTCYQCHAHGRRAGLKIRSSQEGVGSSPTFGTKTTSPLNPGKSRGSGRTTANRGVLSGEVKCDS